VPEPVTIAPAQPAIFTKENKGEGQALIFKEDGTTLAEPGTPVAAGDLIIVRSTGLGAVDPPVAAGEAAPESPRANVVAPVSLTIGGIDAEVVSAVLDPGNSGFYRVEARVPAGVPTGDAVPVVITAGNQSSPAVTIAIQ
jgi:uncharacterized protein (TIGR03437 family)